MTYSIDSIVFGSGMTAAVCGVCGGALEPSIFGGYVHADDADDTHTPMEAS